jgi:hypothetical protein
MHCRDPGRIWLAHDATANLGFGQRAGGGRCFRVRIGFDEGIGLRPFEDYINNKEPAVWKF